MWYNCRTSLYWTCQVLMPQESYRWICILCMPWNDNINSSGENFKFVGTHTQYRQQLGKFKW